MIYNHLLLKYRRCLFLILCVTAMSAQTVQPDFCDRVSYGGNLGLSFGNGYFSASVAPSAIYKFNPYFSAGPGLNFSYTKEEFYDATLVGGSFIALVNPYRFVQFSVELEELYVNQKISYYGPDQSRQFWSTALFLGLGYRTGPVTFGVRYNVFYRAEDRVYADAFQPFVRAYF